MATQINEYKIDAAVYKRLDGAGGVNVGRRVGVSGAMKAAHELNLRIPEDVSIVGCGNLVSPYATEPSLTTLEIHLEKMVVTAAELLDKICSGSMVEDTHTIFSPELIVRQSTGPARK